MCNETGNPAYDGYGVINKSLWGHKVFRRLGAEEKLLFLFLIAGPETQPSGYFHVSTTSMRAALSRGEVIIPVIERLEGVELIEYDGSTVWVRGMYEAIKDGGTLLAALEQVRAMPNTGPRTRFMRHHDISESTGEKSGMLEAVATVTKVDALQFSTNDIRRVNVLEQINYAPEDILRLYSQPDGLWYTSDWRGMKSPPQIPTLTNIEKTIGSLSTADPVRARIDKSSLVAHVKGMQRRGYGTKDASESIFMAYNSDVWEAMMQVMKWRDWLYYEGDVKFKVYEALGVMDD